MKLKLLVGMTLVAIIAFIGCTKSEDNNPAGPTTQYLTIQSDSDSLYDTNYYIDSVPTETDSALYAEVSPTQTGKLFKVKIMFGNWNPTSGGVYQVPGNGTTVAIFSKSGTGPGTQMGTTQTIGTIHQNTAGHFAWTEVAFDAMNLSITNGTHFYIAVTPHFNDRTASSTERLFIGGETTTPSTTPVETWILDHDQSFNHLTNLDAAVSAVISY